MLKVVLEYTNCLDDQRIFFKILASYNIKIIKTRSLFLIRPRVTIYIDDYNKLNVLILDLNKTCCYGVRVVRVRTINKLDNKISIYNSYKLNTKRKSG